MSDEMINKSSPTPKKGVDGIGDTQSIHYKEWNMNLMNDPVSVPEHAKSRAYTQGQPKGS